MVRLPLLPVLFALTTATLATPAGAAPAPLAQVEMSLWPEYDKPAMLVIYHLVVAEDAALPATVSLRLPDGIQAPHAVAYVGKDGALYNAEHQVTSEAGGPLLTITLPERQGQVELYAPIVNNGETRNFSISWNAPEPVGTLSYSLQQPPTATDLKLDPPAADVAEDKDGLTYHHASLGPVAAGLTVKIGVRYSKPDETFTVTKLAFQGSTPAMPPPQTEQAAPMVPQSTQPQPETPAPSDDWFYFAASAVLLLVLVGVWRGRGKKS